MARHELFTPEEAEKIETAQRSAEAHAERLRLRDTFAAAALSGLLDTEDSQAEPWRMDHVCVWAYAWADAMLAQRDRGLLQHIR